MNQAARPTLAVFKFASCDGCQLSLLDCEDELLSIAELVDITNFPEASRSMREGPYDICLVEGSITTEHDRQRLEAVREQCSTLICIGACATAGGLQALRNSADVNAFARSVYPHPEYLSTLERSIPIAECVPVDYELQGCPIDKQQLLTVLLAFVAGQRPVIARESVCMACKARGNTCVLVASGEPCLGPITQGGCGALCPSYNRGCYGCFGVKESAQVAPLVSYLQEHQDISVSRLKRGLRAYNAGAPALVEVVDMLEAAAPAEGPT